MRLCFVSRPLSRDYYYDDLEVFGEVSISAKNLPTPDHSTLEFILPPPTFFISHTHTVIYPPNNTSYYYDSPKLQSILGYQFRAVALISESLNRQW